jgi:hypothetical protein
MRNTYINACVLTGMLPGLAGFIAGGATTAAAGAAAVAAAAATAAREDPLSVGCYCAVVCDNGQVSAMYPIYYFFCTLYMHAIQCMNACMYAGTMCMQCSVMCIAV